MPLPASTTTRSGRPPSSGTRARRWAAYSARVSSLGHRAAVGARGLARAGEQRDRQVADLGEAGVQADRAGAAAAQLEAVVARGVVAGGEHHPRGVAGAGHEVQLVGRGEPDDLDDGAGLGGTLGEGLGQLGRGRAHVVPDGQAGLGAVGLGQDDEGGEGGAEGPAGPRVDLLADDASDVVGLDDVQQGVGHAATLGAARPAPGGSAAGGAQEDLGDGDVGAGLLPAAVLAVVARHEVDGAAVGEVHGQAGEAGAAAGDAAAGRRGARAG